MQNPIHANHNRGKRTLIVFLEINDAFQLPLVLFFPDNTVVTGIQHNRLNGRLICELDPNLRALVYKYRLLMRGMVENYCS